MSSRSRTQGAMRAAGASFLLLGFLGRLPAAFNQLGMLLIVAAAGRGLAAAGTAVAAIGVGTAIGAPVIGRTADRFGPVRVMWAAMLLQAASLTGIMLALVNAAPTAVLLACAAVLGAANPQAGSIARACWSGIARQQPPAAALHTVQRGFGYETAADETSFVIGPLVAGLLVTLCGPLGATAVFLMCTIVFEGAFAIWLSRHPQLHSRQHSLASTPPHSPAIQKRLPLRDLATPLIAVFATGTVFGATQTALTAINQAAGQDALTGPIYGAMGITSALAGFLAPSLQWPWQAKLLLGGSLVATCSTGIALLPGTAPTLLLILLMGTGIGGILSTAYTELEAQAPRGRITQVMTIAATCLVLGLSAGSLTSGLLSSELHLANASAIIAGLSIMLAAALSKRRKP